MGSAGQRFGWIGELLGRTGRGDEPGGAPPCPHHHGRVGNHRLTAGSVAAYHKARGGASHAALWVVMLHAYCMEQPSVARYVDVHHVLTDGVV